MRQTKWPKGWRVWRGRHRPTNQSYAVRRVSVLTKALLPFHTYEARDYAYGRLPPNFPVPAIMRCAWCDSPEHTTCGEGEYCPDRKSFRV